jgi:hypothetical protein
MSTCSWAGYWLECGRQTTQAQVYAHKRRRTSEAMGAEYLSIPYVFKRGIALREQGRLSMLS